MNLSKYRVRLTRIILTALASKSLGTGGCPTEYTVFLQFGFQEEWMELGHNLFGIC